MFIFYKSITYMNKLKTKCEKYSIAFVYFNKLYVKICFNRNWSYFCSIKKNLRNMKQFLFIITCSFFLINLNAQVVYSCQYKSDADVKVYVSKYKSDADLVVFKCKYKSDATGNNGLWYFAQYRSDAKKKIYFVDYKSDADLIIYFSEYKSDAGWIKKEKQHLMF